MNYCKYCKATTAYSFYFNGIVTPLVSFQHSGFYLTYSKNERCRYLLDWTFMKVIRTTDMSRHGTVHNKTTERPTKCVLQEYFRQFGPLSDIYVMRMITRRKECRIKLDQMDLFHLFRKLCNGPSSIRSAFSSGFRARENPKICMLSWKSQQDYICIYSGFA